MNQFCQECGCKLWSDHYQGIGICSQCAGDDDKQSGKDLEERLEDTLND